MRPLFQKRIPKLNSGNSKDSQEGETVMAPTLPILGNQGKPAGERLGRHEQRKDGDGNGGSSTERERGGGDNELLKERKRRSEEEEEGGVVEHVRVKDDDGG
ncbi:hypothetical protein Csa_001719 [Cucumis sativus]|uniref:Uncharacterized protein n=1 Tax=Cucumis sativus TaxID=3659 RepID=A0A0A0LBR5_CUCSA|nr:hypothetical protein Csa_001719 [Cucumis sativus]